MVRFGRPVSDGIALRSVPELFSPRQMGWEPVVATSAKGPAATSQGVLGTSDKTETAAWVAWSCPG